MEDNGATVVDGLSLGEWRARCLLAEQALLAAVESARSARETFLELAPPGQPPRFVV